MRIMKREYGFLNENLFVDLNFIVVIIYLMINKNNPCSNLNLIKDKIKELNGIKFKIEFYPDGNWTAESLNIDGIITGGDNVKDVNSLIKDAVFTYFEVPPQFCDDSFLKTDNEPAVVVQKVYA